MRLLSSHQSDNTHFVYIILRKKKYECLTFIWEFREFTRCSFWVMRNYSCHQFRAIKTKRIVAGGKKVFFLKKWLLNLSHRKWGKEMSLKLNVFERRKSFWILWILHYSSLYNKCLTVMLLEILLSMRKINNTRVLNVPKTKFHVSDTEEFRVSQTLWQI